MEQRTLKFADQTRRVLFDGLPVSARMKRFLLAVDALAGDEEHGLIEGPHRITDASIDQLAGEMRVSRRTAQAAIAEARVTSVAFITIDLKSGYRTRFALDMLAIEAVGGNQNRDGSAGSECRQFESGKNQKNPRKRRLAPVQLHGCKSARVHPREVARVGASVEDPHAYARTRDAFNHASKTHALMHAAEEVLKSEEGRTQKADPWEGGLVVGELSDVAALRARFRESIRKRWVLDASQEWLGFVAAACQARTKGRHPCRLFSSLVKQAAWRSSGKGGLPESAFDCARELIRRAQDPNSIRGHPDLQKSTEPQQLGAVVSALKSKQLPTLHLGRI